MELCEEHGWTEGEKVSLGPFMSIPIRRICSQRSEGTGLVRPYVRKVMGALLFLIRICF